MKTGLSLIPAITLFSMCMQGQIVQPVADAESPIGPHHRRIETVTTLVDENGQKITETNSIIHLQAGLNLWSPTEQAWVSASDEIELLNGGRDGALARKAQHQVLFPVSLNTTNGGGIIVQMPDGKVMHARVLGLAITDSTNPAKSLMLAEVQRSVGTLVGVNQVVYEKAFGSLADIRYSMGLHFVEQDLILREQLPFETPEELGFSSETARIEIWTEIIEGDAPNLTVRGGRQEVDFGSMKLDFGRAFKLSADGQAEMEGTTDVQREWTTVDGKTFIIEMVPFKNLKPFLDVLPAQSVAKKLDREKLEEAWARNTGEGRRQPVWVAAASPASFDSATETWSRASGAAL